MFGTVLAHQGVKGRCAARCCQASLRRAVIGRHGAIRRTTQTGSSTFSACPGGVAMPITSSHLVANAALHAAVVRQRIS